MNQKTLITLKNISKSLYDINGRTINKNIPVLKSVDFDVQKGEVHVLLGENGAGKSTLMKVLCGAIPADKGHLEFNGKRVNIHNTQEAHQLGVRLVAQEFSLCSNLSVARNIFLGKEIRKSFFGTLDILKMREEAKKHLQKLNSDIDVQVHVGKLTVAQQQMVEIAKALSVNPLVLILDEPTSALADDQVRDLFSVLRTLTAKGMGIVYISHKLNEVFDIGDRVTVLRDGSTVGTVLVKDLHHVDDLVHMMVGQKLDTFFSRRPVRTRKIALEINNLYDAKGILKDINANVHFGEIVLYD